VTLPSGPSRKLPQAVRSTIGAGTRGPCGSDALHEIATAGVLLVSIAAWASMPPHTREARAQVPQVRERSDTRS
jgi:hypothetical protein